MKQFRVYYNNNVESNQVADFNTLEQAKQHCLDECDGYESVCNRDTEYEHRATTKHYEVFDGDPYVLDEDGDVVDFKEPVYETGCYYID